MTQPKFTHKLLLFFALYVVIYTFFFQWQVRTVYGDDLYLFQEKDGFRFSDLIYHPLDATANRSINRFFIYSILELFDNNLHLYYLLNVLVHAACTYVLALTINIFLRSFFVSGIISLILGLSRFSYYNVSQISFGAALEGCGVLLFSLMLYYVVRAMRSSDTGANVTKSLFTAIIYAALCPTLTHPRYIVLFPFMLIVVFFFPFKENISLRTKVSLFIAVLSSMLIYAFIKIFIFNQPLLIGTASSDFHFNIATALGYFEDAIISIFQINPGPDYLMGIRFDELPRAGQLIAFTTAIICMCLMLIFVVRMPQLIMKFYLIRVLESPVFKKNLNEKYLPEICIFIILTVACIVPAISTIRLEQRWLVAPFSVFILILVVQLCTFKINNNTLRHSLLIFLSLCFIAINYMYFSLGYKNLYFYTAEATSYRFKKAMEKGVIRPNTINIYILEKKMDPNFEGEITWALAGGYFFKVYQKKEKHVLFFDSLYSIKNGDSIYNLKDFDPKNSQIIEFSPDIKDITADIMKSN